MSVDDVSIAATAQPPTPPAEELVPHPQQTPPEDIPTGEQMVVNDVVVDLWDHAPLIELVRQRLMDDDGPALSIGSINVDHLHHFGRHRIDLPNDPDRTGVAWKHLADGAPVVARAALLTGRRWPRLTGADLLPDLLWQAQHDGRSVGFLGGMPEVHAALRVELARRYPRLKVAGFWAPERATIDNPRLSDALAEQVRGAGVDMLVVGLGKPRQEIWINRHGAATGARVLLAFGASADFIAGKVRRAPKILQRLGLEWAYRLSREPRRLARRYLIEGPQAAIMLHRATRP